MKGVVIRDGAVVLLKNDRDEWELPGGKLELTESPETCVVREIAEELHLAVTAEAILDAWIFTIAAGVHVVVLTFGCSETSACDAVLSDEHKELRWVPVAELEGLNMPEGYKTSIRSWAARLAGGRRRPAGFL